MTPDRSPPSGCRSCRSRNPAALTLRTIPMIIEHLAEYSDREAEILVLARAPGGRNGTDQLVSLRCVRMSCIQLRPPGSVSATTDTPRISRRTREPPGCMRSICGKPPRTSSSSTIRKGKN